MDCCLLCRKTEFEGIGYIRVNGTQWQRENVRNIIEKHFWPMNTKSSTAKLCMRCWQQIKNFNSFYTLIAKAHTVLGTINVKEPMQNCNKIEKDNVAINKGTDILKEQLPSIGYMIEHKSSVLKDDLKDIMFNPLLHKKRLRSGCPPKGMTSDLDISNMDPLTEPNISLHDFETPCKSFDEVKACKKICKNPDKSTQQEHDEMIAEQKKICCGLCQIPLDNFIELRKHFRRDHNKRGFIVCCKKKMFNRPTLVDHLKLHMDPNYFKCKLCGKVYSDRSTLENHIKGQLNNEKDMNHTCNEFDKPSTLADHLKLHMDPNYFKCKLCEKVYSDRSTLEKHIKGQFNSENGKTDTYNECDKPFRHSTQLVNHNLTHAPDCEKDFLCDECDKSFTTSCNLNYHIQAIHRNKCRKTKRNSKLATLIHCDICGLCLGDNQTLKQHKNSQHPVDGNKEYSCNKCCKASPNLSALPAHETDYIHKCKICDKASKMAKALKDHTATRTGTPSNTCAWWPKTFISNVNLYNHRKNALPKKLEDILKKLKKHSYTVCTVGNCNMSL